MDVTLPTLLLTFLALLFRALPVLFIVGSIYVLWLGRKYLPILWKILTAKSEEEYLAWKDDYCSKHGLKIRATNEISCSAKKHGLNKNTAEEIQRIHEGP